MATLTEADVEQAALGWQVAHGPDIAPDTPNATITTQVALKHAGSGTFSPPQRLCGKLTTKLVPGN